MQKRSLVDRVYESILTKLDIGELRPGDRIVEDRIAQEVGVSRTPVRSALEKLVAQGLLQKHNHQGCFVPKLGVFEIYEIFEAREALEGLAARLMAARGNDAEVAMLWETHSELVAAESAGDFERHRLADVEFHRQIITGCGELFVSEVVNAEALVTMTFLSYLPVNVVPSRSWDDGIPHEDIVAAIEAHDAHTAEMLAQNHIRTSKEKLLRLFERPGALQRAGGAESKSESVDR